MAAKKSTRNTSRALAHGSGDLVDRQRAAAKRAKRGRAGMRAAHLAQNRIDVDERALTEAVDRLATEAPPARPRSSRARRDGPAPLGFAANDTQRWVPIGPSVTRQGQANGRPRVTGRIRDLHVEPTLGVRAYAATAKGGVWYTPDGGASWQPVGGWAAGPRGAGGLNSSHSCGAILVAFGATAALDLVMVGTGEPTAPMRHATVPVHGGVGVLAAVGPAAATVGTRPWESESGLTALAGLGIARLVRDPAATPGKTAAPNLDRVLAATTGGLFLGTRTRVPANGPVPAHDEYQWTGMTVGLAALIGSGAGTPIVSDVLWLAGGGANGRIVVALNGPPGPMGTPGTQGVAVSTDLGRTFTRVNFAGAAPVVNSRMSLARAGATNRVYLLGDRAGPAPEIWQIPSVAAAPPVATPLGGVPAGLWGGQRDYDQAIAVDVVAGVDRVYIGGSGFRLPAAGGIFNASLFAFEVHAAAPRLRGIPGVSAIAGAPRADEADQTGLIGNNVHADVHAIELAGPPGNRQVWVGCDGGVYRSGRNGRVNTFQSRANGLAALEVGFHAAHPTSSHFGIIGCQDNGTQVRVGDSVWEATFMNDGGGVTFHDTRPQYVVQQTFSGFWGAQPARGFHSPLFRTGIPRQMNPAGGGQVNGVYVAEHNATAFYSGLDSIALNATESRVAIGTNRVWLSDDIGRNAINTWRVIGFPNGPGTDQAGSAAAPNWVGVPQQAAGPAVPVGSLGPVMRVRWASPTNLLVLYRSGIVRYTQAGANWTTTFITPGTPGGPNPANEIFTDIAPLPNVGGADTNDFYVTTTGVAGTPAVDTCWFFDASAGTFTATNLRRQLDTTGPPIVPGPLDPAYAVVVDPTNASVVFVGTVTGVWRGTRGAANAHAWGTGPFVNGLPEAAVQDLTIWTDPGGAPAPRLLRAAVQSRGVWEVDLAAASEPQRTYVRVHERDDRRRFPTPMANPRRRPTAPPVVPYASPDITVRPQWPVATAPNWRLGSSWMASARSNGYQLWTFQTAFRWHYPSLVADGEWSDQLGDLVELHRNSDPALPVGAASRRIDRAMWDAIVGQTRLTPTGQTSTSAANPLAVYRQPWQDTGALTVPATEIDLMDTVVAPQVRAGSVWRVHNEPSTVDVLLHHRDTRPLPVNDAFAIVMWRSAPGQNAALNTDGSGLPAYARSLLTGAPTAPPSDWNLAVDGSGAAVHRLGTTLDARVPTAVSVDIDFSGVPNWHRVLVVAFAGSNTDPMTTAPAAVVTNVTSLVANWPHASMRLLQMIPRR